MSTNYISRRHCDSWWHENQRGNFHCQSISDIKTRLVWPNQQEHTPQVRPENSSLQMSSLVQISKLQKSGKWYTYPREWLGGLARCLWSEFVRFNSHNIFEKQLLGLTPTLLTLLHGLAWCARNSGLPPYKQLVPPSWAVGVSPNAVALMITFCERWKSMLTGL